MAFFPDLTPYTYFPGAPPGVVNIGWLDPAHPFPTGKTSRRFRTKLVELCKRPVMQTRGLHICGFCTDFDRMEEELQTKARSEGRFGPDIQELHEAWNHAHQGVPMPFGSAEIHVAGEQNEVYAAPEMIAHYVVMHSYCPPKVFVDAVLQCTECAEVWPRE
jgi:hypothetical protein